MATLRLSEALDRANVGQPIAPTALKHLKRLGTAEVLLRRGMVELLLGWRRAIPRQRLS